MPLKGYNGAREVAMPQEAKDTFDAGIKKIKETIIKSGFDPAAAEMLEIKFTGHTLTISEEERISGAYHSHADGKPFYALSISAPGSLFDLGSPTEKMPPTSLNPLQQAVYLAFEIGTNVASLMNRALTEILLVPDTDGTLTSGVTSSIGPTISFETATRCDPALYCVALNELTALRLKQLVPAAPAAKAPRQSFKL